MVVFPVNGYSVSSVKDGLLLYFSVKENEEE